MLRTIRFAIRSLWRAPLALVGSVLCLGLGIGAAVTVLAVVESLYLAAPSGVLRPREVVRIEVSRNARGRQMVGARGLVSYQTLMEVTASLPADFRVAGYSTSRPLLRVGQVSERSDVQLVSGAYFALLGVRAASGRLLGETDVQGSIASPVAVISHDFWQEHFGGRGDAVGSTVFVNDNAFTIVGVAASGFNGVHGGKVEAWLPIERAVDAGYREESVRDHLSSWISMLGRLSGKRTAARLQMAVVRTLTNERPDERKGRDSGVRITELGVAASNSGASGGRTSSVPSIAMVLAAFAGLLLVIACVNVMNILLVRGLERRRELATRLALGAPTAEMIRLLVAESAVVSALGAALGLLTSAWGRSLMRALPGPEQPYAVGPLALAGAICITALACLVAGAIPGLRLIREIDPAALREEGSTAGVRVARFRAVLMALQVCLAVVLLSGAAVMLRSMTRLQQVDTGYRLDELVTISRDPYAGIPSRSTNWDAVLAPLRQELAAAPGVRAVTVSMGSPLQSTFATEVSRLGEAGDGQLTVRWEAVDSGYFQAVGMRIVRGTAISGDHLSSQPRAAVVNEAFAAAMWPGVDPIGQCFVWAKFPDLCIRVIGVATNALYNSVHDTYPPLFYVPLTTEKLMPFRTILVRTSEGAEEALPAVRQLLSRAERSQLRRFVVAPAAAAMARDVELARHRALALLSFGFVALIMVAVGLYGSVAFTVAQRRREIGIRLSLGASPVSLCSKKVLQVLQVCIVGAVIGVGIALLLGPFFGRIAFRAPVLDPGVLVGPVALVLIVSAAAAYVPTRRVVRGNPMQSLRA